MNLELVEQVLAGVVGGLLALSALLTLIRITIGPSVLDRVVATDVMVSVVVCALGAHAALTSGSSTLPLLISLSLVGFMGSVAVARFVARDRDPESGEENDRVVGEPDRAHWPRHSGARGGISRSVWEPGVRSPGGRGATLDDHRSGSAPDDRRGSTTDDRPRGGPDDRPRAGTDGPDGGRP